MALRLYSGVLSTGMIALVGLLLASPARCADNRPAAEPAGVGLFDAIKSGDVEVQFIAKSDREAKVVITNKTKKPVSLQLPAAFAGVPVAAQIGGGGLGGGGIGGGGQTQSVGGGFGGGGGGIGGGGLGGGAFSIPPEEVAKLDVPVLCLEHGKRDPSSSKAYEIRPADSVVDRAGVVEMLTAFGTGQLDHGAAQAAVWNLNNDLPWNELAQKQTGNVRSGRRDSYFTAAQIQAGMRYGQQAMQLAAEKKAEERAVESLSKSLSDDSVEPQDEEAETTEPAEYLPGDAYTE